MGVVDRSQLAHPNVPTTGGTTLSRHAAATAMAVAWLGVTPPAHAEMPPRVQLALAVVGNANHETGFIGPDLRVAYRLSPLWSMGASGAYGWGGESYDGAECGVARGEGQWRGEAGVRVHPNGERVLDWWLGGEVGFVRVNATVTESCYGAGRTTTSRADEEHFAPTLGATAGVSFRSSRPFSVDVGGGVAYAAHSRSDSDRAPMRAGTWLSAMLGVSFYL